MATSSRTATDREVIGLCDELLGKFPDNELAPSIKAEAKKRLKARRRKEFSKLEEEGTKSYRAEDMKKQ